MEIVVPLMANYGKVQAKSRDKNKYLEYQTKFKNHKTTWIPHKKQNGGCGSHDG